MNLLVQKWGERMVRSRQYAAVVALIAAFFSFFSMPFIGFLSTIIIALVTLQNGPKLGLFVAAWAMLPAVALLYLGQYGIFINVVLLHYLVALIFAVALRKYGSWISLLQLGTFVGVATVAALYYFAPDLQDLLVGQLTAFAKEYKSSLFSFKSSDIDLWIKYIGLFATGLLAIGILISNLVTLFLARGWQSTLNPSVNVQKECHGIRLHFSVSLLLVVFIIGLFFNRDLFINLLVVAMLPFIISGLSLLHAYSATRKKSTTILFVFYTLFLFLSPYLIFLSFLMGWLDSFVNFRKRIMLNQAIRE